jgi:hypothetical protein
MPVMFVSYRRTDSQDVTGRIYDRLAGKYGAQRIFKDVDNIPLGVSFPMHLQQVLSKARVVLVIIGPSWTTARDENGKRRLDNPNDFVRVEVECALRGKMPVIPILVSNARMPTADELPRSMQALAARNGMAIRPDPDFNNDINRLFSGIDKLEKLLRAQDLKKTPRAILVAEEIVQAQLVALPPRQTSRAKTPASRRPRAARAADLPAHSNAGAAAFAVLILALVAFVILGLFAGIWALLDPGMNRRGELPPHEIRRDDGLALRAWGEGPMELDELIEARFDVAAKPGPDEVKAPVKPGKSVPPPEAPRRTIKQVMSEAYKGGLAQKVRAGNASMDEKARLLELYEDLASNPPPKGNAADWNARTAALVDSARSAVKNEPGYDRVLVKAMNCAGCHKKHK